MTFIPAEQHHGLGIVGRTGAAWDTPIDDPFAISVGDLDVHAIPPARTDIDAARYTFLLRGWYGRIILSVRIPVLHDAIHG